MKRETRKKLLESITKIQNVPKVRRMRRVTLENKVIVFKTLLFSEILSLIWKVPWPSKSRFMMKPYALTLSMVV